MASSLSVFQCDDTFGALAKQSTAALQVTGSIPTRNKYFCGLQIVDSGLRGFNICKCSHHTEFIPSVGQLIFTNKTKIYKKRNEYYQKISVIDFYVLP